MDFQIQLHKIIDLAQCWDLLRSIRWADGVHCPYCGAQSVVKNGKDKVNIHCQHYQCKACKRYFDDVTNTLFSGSRQPLHHWIVVLYLMNLKASTLRISQELGIEENTAARMCELIREGVVKKKPVLQLSGESEADECYVTAGHKGQPDRVAKAGRVGRKRRLKGKRGRGTSASEKNPVFGIVGRAGGLCLWLVDNVKRGTIEPLIKQTVVVGSTLYTDEYRIYHHLAKWGYEHKSVDHSKGEYARDENGDGHHEVHCNTIEGIWSLLRSWLGAYRGVSQAKLPFYVGYFEWLYNVRKRGENALHDTFCLLLQPDVRTYDDCLLSVCK